MHKRGLCHHACGVCLSVHLSCLCIVSVISLKFFHHQVARPFHISVIPDIDLAVSVRSMTVGVLSVVNSFDCGLICSTKWQHLFIIHTVTMKG